MQSSLANPLIILMLGTEEISTICAGWGWEAPGMRGGKANALDALDIMDVVQQVCQRVGSAARAVFGKARQISAIGVYVLPQQGHFPVASVSQSLDLPLQPRHAVERELSRAVDKS